MVEHMGRISLDRPTVTRLESFHATVFEDVLRMGGDTTMRMDKTGSREMLVVPLKGRYDRRKKVTV